MFANRIASLTLSAALVAGSLANATPAHALSAEPQDGQEYPWTMFTVPGYGVTNLTESEQIEADRREKSITLQTGHLYGAEYSFKAVNSADAPTKEMLPRFFEWNPGNGKLSSVHILNDELSVRKAHIALGDRNAKEQALGKGEYLLVNEDSWADGVAAQAFSQRVNGAQVLTTSGDTLSPWVREFLLNQKNEHNGNAPYVTLIGGEKVLSEEIVREIHNMGGKVNRLSGESRVETMLEVARAYKTHRADLQRLSHDIYVPEYEKFKVTRGYAEEGDTNTSAAYADAINTAKSDIDFPLLSTTDQLHPAVVDFIKNETRVSGVECADASFVLIGGEKALSSQVERDIQNLKTCEGQDFKISRIAGDTRYHTNVVDIAQRINYDDNVLSGTTNLIIADGQSSNMWRTVVSLNQSHLHALDLVYVQGDDIPAVSQRLIRSFGRSYRLNNHQTRSVFCYASASACAKVRELMDKGPNGGNWEVTDDPARPLSKFVK